MIISVWALLYIANEFHIENMAVVVNNEWVVMLSPRESHIFEISDGDLVEYCWVADGNPEYCFGQSRIVIYNSDDILLHILDPVMWPSTLGVGEF